MKNRIYMLYSMLWKNIEYKFYILSVARNFRFHPPVLTSYNIYNKRYNERLPLVVNVLYVTNYSSYPLIYTFRISKDILLLVYKRSEVNFRHFAYLLPPLKKELLRKGKQDDGHTTK